DDSKTPRVTSMMGKNSNALPNRAKAETWAQPFPKKLVLVGDASFMRDAESYFGGHVSELELITIPTDGVDDNALPPGFPLQGPWCIVCDLVTSHHSLRVARRLLLNTANVPLIAIASDPAEIPDPDLRSLLECGITEVLPVPRTWHEAWTDIKK